eukprot:m.118615 g.118615  ORF g.118615 m.118615 type:complete len:453 (+) comp17215_c0_seq3:154-1512(+)
MVACGGRAVRFTVNCVEMLSQCIEQDDFADANAKVLPDSFIRQIPKCDLHVHLDGSVRLDTLLELCRKESIEIPADSVEELREKIFKDSYQSLEEYLECFKYTTAVMCNPENLERIAYEFAWDNYNEGVLYFEVRFAPQLHATRKMNIEAVLHAVNKGLLRARDERNSDECIINGQTPPCEYGIIVCAMRSFTEEMSEYFHDFIHVHRFEHGRRLFSLASMALVTAAVEVRRVSSIPIVAIDIAGAEAGFPASAHIDAFTFAQKHFMGKTVHAGEGFGPESIFQAITDLNADRIGHGFHLFNTDRLKDPDELHMSPNEYVNGLCEYVAQRRVTFEVCLTSNRQTMPELSHNLKLHPLRRMLDERLSVSLNTDNRTVSATSMSRELRLAADTFDISPKEMKDIVLGGFKRSFFPRNYVEKRKYVRQVIDYYTSIEEKFNVIQRHRIASGCTDP